MKKIFFLFSILFFSLSLSAQTPDTAFVQAAADLYQSKVNKAGVAISATAPFPIFRKIDAKMKWIEENAAKNTVISISTTLFSTGNTPYSGKFVRENGGSVITCFIDQTGVKHEINKKYLPSVGNSGVQVDANNPTSDFLGAFVKEEGKAYITAYVDVYGTRHAVGVDATTLATKTALVDSSTALRNNINYVRGISDTRADSINAVKVNKTELTLDNVLSVGNTSNRSMTVGTIIGRGNPGSGASNFVFGTGMYSAVTGTNNIGVGRDVMGSLVSGISNTGMGSATAYSNISGSYNAYFGFMAARYKTSGDFGVFIGGRSMWKDSVSNNNVMVGWETFANAQGGNNIGIGFQAGYFLQSGNNNIVVGANSNPLDTIGDNQLSIGNWIYGKDGRVSIGGTVNPTNQFEVAGTDAIRIPNGTTAERPSSTNFGQIRYNTTLGRGEMYVNDANGDGTQGDAGWRVF